METLFCRGGGYIYVCGKIGMAEQVEKTLRHVLMEFGKMESITAENTMEEMRKNYRYQEDIFG